MGLVGVECKGYEAIARWEMSYICCMDCWWGIHRSNGLSHPLDCSFGMISPVWYSYTTILLCRCAMSGCLYIQLMVVVFLADNVTWVIFLKFLCKIRLKVWLWPLGSSDLNVDDLSSFVCLSNSVIFNSYVLLTLNFPLNFLPGFHCLFPVRDLQWAFIKFNFYGIFIFRPFCYS